MQQATIPRDTALNYLMGFAVEMRSRRDPIVWSEWRDPANGQLFTCPSTADNTWRFYHSDKDYDHQIIAICGIPASLLGMDP